MLRTGREMHMRWLFPDEEIVPLAALPFLNEVTIEILPEDDPALHPPFPFVAISQHDGYFFSFRASDGASGDPEIMGYSEGRGFRSTRQRRMELAVGGLCHLAAGLWCTVRDYRILPDSLAGLARKYRI